jgi:hypothetical protein
MESDDCDETEDDEEEVDIKPSFDIWKKELESKRTTVTTAFESELPPGMLDIVNSKCTRLTRNLFLLDAVKGHRTSYFECYDFLIYNFHETTVKKIQEMFSGFIISTADEWYKCIIPIIQHNRNPIIHEFLRLMLRELLSRGFIQRTPGWNYVVVRSALLYWCRSPIPSSANDKSSYSIKSDSDTCIYCQCSARCMVSDNCSIKGKFKCFIEGGVHLCSEHGDYLLGSNGSLCSNLELKDGRRVFYCGKNEYIDLHGVDIGYNLLYTGKEPSRTEIKHFLVTNHNLDRELEISPAIHDDMERLVIGPCLPPLLHQDEMRDYLVRRRIVDCPQTSWDCM